MRNESNHGDHEEKKKPEAETNEIETTGTSSNRHVRFDSNVAGDCLDDSSCNEEGSIPAIAYAFRSPSMRMSEDEEGEEFQYPNESKEDAQMPLPGKEKRRTSKKRSSSSKRKDKEMEKQKRKDSPETVEGSEPNITPSPSETIDLGFKEKYENKLKKAGVGAVSSCNNEDRGGENIQEFGTWEADFSNLSQQQLSAHPPLYSMDANRASAPDPHQGFTEGNLSYSMAYEYGEPVVAIAVEEQPQPQSAATSRGVPFGTEHDETAMYDDVIPPTPPRTWCDKRQALICIALAFAAVAIALSITLPLIQRQKVEPSDSPTQPPSKRVPTCQFAFDLKTDDNGQETSWTLIETDTNFIVARFREGEYSSNHAYRKISNLFDGNYSFTIYDQGGNGIQPPGYYRISLGGVELASGGDFGDAETTVFEASNCERSLAPAPSTTLMPTGSSVQTSPPTQTSSSTESGRTPEFSETPVPTLSPVKVPSEIPVAPPTGSPTGSPTVVTTDPPVVPPIFFSSQPPTTFPVTAFPTFQPTQQPLPMPTQAPVGDPTPGPTFQLTQTPTKAPVTLPTKAPSKAPVVSSTFSPSQAPSKEITSAPSRAPIPAPTKQPSMIPTPTPTKPPTKAPVRAPTKVPTKAPTFKPTKAPSKAPIRAPTKQPSKRPTSTPTKKPTKAPVFAPTKAPTKAPTFKPTQVRIVTPSKPPFTLPPSRGEGSLGSSTPAPTLEGTAQPTVTYYESDGSFRTVEYYDNSSEYFYEWQK